MNKYRRLAEDTLIFAVGNLGSKIILFFMVPLYTKCLTTEDYGTADLVFTIAELLIPFVSLVIFDAVLRFGLSKKENTDSVLKSSCFILLIGSILTMGLAPLFRLYAPLTEWRLYLCAYVILTMIGSVETTFLKVINKNRAYAVISVLSTAVLAVANLLLLLVWNLGIRGYLISAVLSSTVNVAAAFLVGKLWRPFRNGRFDEHLLKQMVLFSTPLILNNVSWWLIKSSDKIMIEAMVDVAALGLYSAAAKIPSLINVIISIFTQAWGISTVKEFESSNDLEFYGAVFSSFTVLGFGASIIITSLAKPFMSIYVSESFREAWHYVPLLVASASFSAVSSFFGPLYGALKKSANTMYSTLVAAVINLSVNLILIRRLGVWGAVIGTVVAYIAISFYRMLDVLRFIRFGPNWRRHLINCTIVLVQAVFVSNDCCIWQVSVAAIVLFALNNQSVFKSWITASTAIKRDGNDD